MIDVVRDGLAYVVRSGEVGTAEAAAGVVAALKGALAQAVAADDYVEFRHRIEFEPAPLGVAPVPDTALHMDLPNDPEMVAALQPGWFWLHVAGLPDGLDVVRDWLAHVDAVYAQESAKLGFEAELWEAGEVGIQLGESAILPLLVEDMEWSDAYIRLLERWDLGHEVNQGPTIDTVLARHGWSDAMRRLLIARVVIDSQHGAEQVFDAMRGRLDALIGADDLTAFYREALSEFHDATKDFLEWPPNDGSAETFGITGPLRALAAEIGT